MTITPVLHKGYLRLWLVAGVAWVVILGTIAIVKFPAYPKRAELGAGTAESAAAEDCAKARSGGLYEVEPVDQQIAMQSECAVSIYGSQTTGFWILVLTWLIVVFGMLFLLPALIVAGIRTKQWVADGFPPKGGD